MRNEEKTIARLLTDIKNQVYPCFEVIIVDDHSDDGSRGAVENWLTENAGKTGFLRLVNNEGVGKKAALALAVQKAKGELIMTTDADCELLQSWISKTVEQFDDQTNLIVGAVRMKGKQFTDHLQQLEFASLIGSGAATLGWQRPTMANGANLAFRKSVFNAVGAYEGNSHIASGDDEFLMRKIHQRFPGSIFFNHNSDTVVDTAAHQNFKSFTNQRIRWASKWALHQSYFSKLLALLIFSFQLAFLLSPWLMYFGYLNINLGLSLILIKAAVEWFFFIPVLRLLRLPINLAAFITLQFIYPYYVVTIGLLANVVGYQWKGRGYNSSKSAH
ncbi:glycosyl transferase family 2 [Chryseotalea sanaruensis]|uniref:Glycosyl transferase family 2 n=2 Tax=Chryseotalea sanaruensis TaxID=2482724 RepID=A0A401U9Y3_9BACT|nr:glycosyl transferase family 2 [Chryseotalea sanaruensis]